MNERQIHRAIVGYLRLALPPEAMVRTIPGGDGSRTLAPGYIRGTADILIVHRGGAYFIEVKGPRGKMSPEQHLECLAADRAGAHYATVRTIEETEETLLGWGILPRVSLKARAA